MGRSKFPGKPPKAVTRKRIKVLGQPASAAEDARHLQEQSPLRVATSPEVPASPQNHHEHESDEEINSAISSNPPPEAPKSPEKEEPLISPVAEPAEVSVPEPTCETPVESPAPKPSRIRRTRTPLDSSERKKKFLSLSKTPGLKVTNMLDRHQRTRGHQLRNAKGKKRLLQRSSQIGHSDKTRKFVLPIRSAHSSRVIKPNKRFIEESDSPGGQEHAEESAKQPKKSKKAKDEEKVEVVEQKKDGQAFKSLPEVSSLESSRVKTRSGTLNEERKDGVQEIEPESTASESENSEEEEQNEWSGKLNGGKVILRKARLKLDNKSLGGTEGPFSVVSTQNNMGMTNSIKCGVCGAVRFQRLVKQTRKFGIQSCVSCRKFVSKMIKRQACAKSTNTPAPMLQCVQGDGLCLIGPAVRNQEWNILRCAYKSRCHACWLKMCLKFYNVPASMRTGLNAMLPPLMRIGLPLSQEVADKVIDNNQKLTGYKLGWPAEDSTEKNLFKSAMTWNSIELGQKSTYQEVGISFSCKKLDKCDYPVSISPNKKRKKDNRIKVRKKIKNVQLTPQQGQQTLRQRVDLRGPRVKHVCRSASVALGQPIATFPLVEGKDEVEDIGKNIPKVQKEEDKMLKKEEVVKEKEIVKSNEGCNISGVVQTQSKRTKAQQSIATTNLSLARSLSKTLSEPKHMISIDFWEQYDPAEVGLKGFALIASEPFHIPAICYLCGSAGKEPMIHCQCCCEPYHPFCLEPSEWNACFLPNWCCPRCTICQSCQLRSGPKLSCIRCRQSFHHSCLSKSGVSARLYSPDRPYVCQSCIKCKSCGSEGVNVHVGNLPLCSMCFKLRQRGNYCPLCQRCYNENDFDTKMMECNECSCWVHARCEGLSDERYQILSYLPDSIEFTCRQCSPSPDSVWRNAIEAELKSGFIAVIKSLSKNRRASAALKWSPRKECLCRPVTSVRKLNFQIQKSESKEPVKDLYKFEDNEDSLSDKPENEGSKFEDVEESLRRGLRRLRQTRLRNEMEKKFQEEMSGSESKECSCSDQQILARPSPTLISVKRKVNGNEYGSLFQFHCDMEHVISRTASPNLTQTYHTTIHEVFPWFNISQYNKEIEGDGMRTPTKDSYKDYEVTPTKYHDPILDIWKEEILKAPKAIAAKTANLYSNISVEDSRSCCLCKGLGDGQETREGRLLYCGQNEWVHSNCALWSNEVFEEIDGSLQNVHSAVSRGRMIRCTECGKKGASVGCCSKNCGNTYHYPCARNINLAFNNDKTVFCTSHLANANRKSQSESDFSLKRSVYVELDRKKKKFAEPDKVKIMIGSLSVDCLGTIVPEYSDFEEKIIPNGYKCSRLYWSTVNPLKIVKYYIRTYIQVCVPEPSVDTEHNVTIDHSIERKDLSIVKQTLDSLIDTVCNKEADENLAEQNNTDLLLPPELKEAIFEDLPHDLLDGISMQDIFPKMSYEDFLAMDLKDDILEEEDRSRDQTENDFPFHLETRNSVQDLVDDLFNSKNQKNRELKRSKSEVFSNGSLPKSHQRSCSLQWSCKLDATVKRRKIPRCSITKQEEVFQLPESLLFNVNKAPEKIEDKDHKRLVWHARQQPRIVQVDGAADSTSSECSSPEYSLEERFPQLDGAGDISSDDECIGQTNFQKEKTFVVTKFGINDRPVTCKRCQCTYRTLDSYNRHQANCEIITTSDSDSEIMDNKLASPDSRFSSSNESMSPQFITMSPSEGHTLTTEYPDVQATSPLEASVPSPHPGMQIEPVAQALITPQIHTHATVETVHQTVLTSNDMIVQTQYTRTTTTLPNATVLPQESGVQITEITDSREQGGKHLDGAMLQQPGLCQRTSTTPQDSSHVITQSPKVAKLKSPRTPKLKNKPIKTYARNSVHASDRTYQVQNSTPVIQLQQAQRPAAPTVIIQPVAPQNLMSTYVETLQQQSGHQNVQYITAINNQADSFKPQYISANQLVPGAYIQASSDNLLALQNGGISVLPNVQIAQPQPTVLGTIIQQPQSAIQCGVISSEQLVLSSAPTLEMFTDSTGSMFVSSQPMYYGLETIVSNTVMSSSQFVAGAVPQVLASSYQTTTQVFQASKLMEPIVDVQVPTMQNMQTVSTLPNVPTVSTMPSVPTVQQNVPNLAGSYVVVNQTPAPMMNQTSIAEPITAQQIAISTPEQTFVSRGMLPSVSPQPVVEQVRPVQNDISHVRPVVSNVNARPKVVQQPTIPRVAVRPSPVAQPETPSWKIAESVIGPEQPMNNSIRPYFDSKHVADNTSMIKSSLSSRIPPLPNHCISQNNFKYDFPTTLNSYNNSATSVTNSVGMNPTVNNACVANQNKVSMCSSGTPTSRPMNRVLPMQAVTQKEEVPIEKPEFALEEPTKPEVKSLEQIEVPEKNVVEIIEPVKKVREEMTCVEKKEADVIETIIIVAEKEPTDNRLDEDEIVEKTEVEDKSLNVEDEKEAMDTSEVENVEDKRMEVTEIEDVPVKAIEKSSEIEETKVEEKEVRMEVAEIEKEVKEVREEDKDTRKEVKEVPKEPKEIKEKISVSEVSEKPSLQNVPLKIVLQKQVEDGHYKVAQNIDLQERSNLINNNSDFSKKVQSKLAKFSEEKKPAAPKVPEVVAVKKPKLDPKIVNQKQTPRPVQTEKKTLKKPSLMYEIKSQDGFTHTASSMNEVWDMVFQAVQKARKAQNLPPLPHNPLTENLGLENNGTIYLIEQLPNVNRCVKYKPRFHELKPPKAEENENDLPKECESGAARAEPFRKRNVHDMFSWLASRHRQQPKMVAISETESRRAACTNLPMAMRFRILKETSKESVGVYHSHIHGRGLFCLRDIEAGEMVIEYAGEVIRSSLTDKREKYYDSKNIGCYMFKIDDHLVVDATMKGNAARFINHSCEPNCYSRVVDILGKKHILIFALRKIVQGEELTYDYKFPFEDIKIPCTCGSRRCRKYLN